MVGKDFGTHEWYEARINNAFRDEVDYRLMDYWVAELYKKLGVINMKYLHIPDGKEESFKMWLGVNGYEYTY